MSTASKPAAKPRARRLEDIDLSKTHEPILVRPSGTIVDMTQRIRYLALFDILGYSQLLKRLSLISLVDLAMRAPAMAHFAASGKVRTAKNKSVVPDRRHSGIGITAYADTLLIYSNGHGVADLVRTIDAAHALMQTLMSQGILLRGAVTKGQFYANKKDGVFTGEALIRAFELEKRQDWAGAIVDLERISAPDEQAVLKEFDAVGKLFQFTAPMKGGPLDTHLCIGWPLGMGMDASDWSTFVGKLYGKPTWQGFTKMRLANDFLQNHRRAWPLPQLRTETGPDGRTRVVGRSWERAPHPVSDVRFQPLTFELTLPPTGIAGVPTAQGTDQSLAKKSKGGGREPS